MASEVEICNRALQKLGATRITSLTEDSRNGRACNACFYVLRDSELRNHPWNFAIKRVQLPANSAAPLFGYDNSFQLPSDFLRLLPPDPKWNRNDLDWHIEGRAIYTDDAAPLNVRYIYQVTDPNSFDPLFREVLAAKMAWEMCEEITQSNTKQSSAKSDYVDMIRLAKRTNAIENVPVDAPYDLWLSVRL